MSHFYSVLDVFTDAVLAGNPLAVVFDADDIEGERMQKIAREFNLSETVFVLRPRDRANSARLRIFTPSRELPFAGHPTIGTAIALALHSERNVFTLEEEVGVIQCTVSRDGRHRAYATFGLPKLPERVRYAVEPDLLARALGLEPDQVITGGARPMAWSAGVPYLAVPVRDRAALDQAWADPNLFEEAFVRDGVAIDPYLYCTETVQSHHSYATRMFAPRAGIPEDPATGSAAAILPAQLLATGALAAGTHNLALEQGVKMGRPSLIHLKVTIAAGLISEIEIGGCAAMLATGTITV